MKTFYQLLANTIMATVTNMTVWFALVFTLTGLIGLCVTLLAMNSKYYRLLSERYLADGDLILLENELPA